MTSRALVALALAVLGTACRSETRPEEADADVERPPASVNDAGGAPAPSTPCGFAGTACCTTSTPCDTRSQCIAGRCEPCGDQRQSCCPGDACVSPLTCATGTCITCGRTGEACCVGAVPCFAGLVCTATGTCASF